MQDPFIAVKEEVLHSVSVVVDLHERWKALVAEGTKSDETEWTSTELISGLRSIEWDLQDLDDTVSIVEGNREKFGLSDGEVEERKAFIESTRKQISTMRDEVQGFAMKNDTPGFSTGKRTGAHLPTIGKSKGYGKVGSQDMEMTPADDDLESSGAVDGNGGMSNGGGNGHGGGSGKPGTSAGDEIIGGEADGGDALAAQALAGRHRKKKLCIAASIVGVLLLVVLLMMRGGGTGAVRERVGAAAAKLSEKLHGSSSLATSTAALTAGKFVRYHGYSGALNVSGSVGPIATEGTTQRGPYALRGVDTQCMSGAGEAANSCGLHLHAGTSCASEALGHHHAGAAGHTDPWASVSYTAKADGTAAGQLHVDTGIAAASVSGHVIVVHAYDGGRIACAVLHSP